MEGEMAAKESQPGATKSFKKVKRMDGALYKSKYMEFWIVEKRFA